jgi:hypothetical protein
VHGLPPNLVSLFITLIASIRLDSLGFGLVEIQIWEQFFQFRLLQFQHIAVFGDKHFGYANGVRLS